MFSGKYHSPISRDHLLTSCVVHESVCNRFPVFLLGLSSLPESSTFIRYFLGWCIFLSIVVRFPYFGSHVLFPLQMGIHILSTLEISRANQINLLVFSFILTTKSIEKTHEPTNFLEKFNIDQSSYKSFLYFISFFLSSETTIVLFFFNAILLMVSPQTFSILNIFILN